ncbi:Ethylene-insensitive protein 2 [Vitis vinifera]|nr:Ethylene-insensitive protein 2 [Vitis vinifera]
MLPCFCLQIPASHQQRSSPPVSNGILPPAVKSVKGKCTSAAMLLEIIKDVEIAISCRKGRTGTAAGDVAFPKGKENLASVLKRYKRRLSNKPVGTHDNMGSGLRKLPTSSTYGS